MKKRLAVLSLLMTLLLTGCFFRGADELYTIPRPPKDYEALQSRLGEVIAAGGEYAAPLSGELIQSVQLQDLDEDGVQEAIAFFRFPSDEKPMKIYIFRQQEDAYEVAAVIELAGTAINCVDYVQMDDDPSREIVVSWQMYDKLHTLAAFSLGDNQVEELMRSDYESYKLCDLDQDNQQELVVFRTPVGGKPQAELYDFRGVLSQSGTAPLSNGITAVADGGIRSGYLKNWVPALFAVSAYGGNGTITDVFVCRDGELRNVTLEQESGESRETIRFYTDIIGTDINNDGIMELPQPFPLTDYRLSTAAVSCWLIHWRQFDEQGNPSPIFTTCHNDRDGWYFILPDAVEDALTLTRADLPGGGERAVIFSYWEGNEDVEPVPFLTIYKLTGTNRVSRANLPGRFVLFPKEGLEEADESNTIYAAELMGEFESGLTEEEVRKRFAIIRTDWLSGY